jgi:hypothetical protein
MSLEHSPARQQKHFRKDAAATRPPPFAAFTVDEFCYSHRMSRSELYKQWRQGTGPRFYRKGKHRLISVEAAADYRREREAAEAASTPA